MKVICKTNNLKDISSATVLARLKKYIFKPDGDVELEIGKEYTVYGVVFWDNSPWYYLCAYDGDDYPVPFAAEFFNVSDDRLSKYWKLSAIDQDDSGIQSFLVFKEWAQDPTFYERLLDDDANALEIFGTYRELINKEIA